MEDMTDTTMEQEQTSLGPAERASADQPGEWQASDSFLDGWEEPVSEAADQPEEITEEAPAQEPDAAPAGQSAGAETAPVAADHAAAEQAENPGQQQEKPPADAPRVWDLKYMDEVRQVGEADMVALAQKGLDYDRIRSRYDESKPVMEMFGQFAKQAGMSIPDYVSYIRTQAKQSQGMSEAEARRAVELEDREAVVAQREAAEAQRQSAVTAQQAARQNANARRQADIAEFTNLFPDAAKDPKSIPQEVWADVRGGMSLVSAYSKYRVAKADADLEAAKQAAAAAQQNQTNAARSSGSMKSAGESSKSRDPFLEGWGE